VMEALIDCQGNDPQAVIDIIHKARLHTFSSLKGGLIKLYFKPPIFCCLGVGDLPQ